MQKEILLRLENISVHYGGVKALDDVSVALDEGEIVVLMVCPMVKDNYEYLFR